MATTDGEIKDAFSVFDPENTGSISVFDIGLVIIALGKAPLETEVDALIDQAGGDRVDFGKFKSLYARKMKKPSDLEADMRQAFRAWDITGNGIISEVELRILLGTLGEAMDNDDIEVLLKCIAPDVEGNLKYDELIDMFLK